MYVNSCLSAPSSALCLLMLEALQVTFRLCQQEGLEEGKRPAASSWRHLTLLFAVRMSIIPNSLFHPSIYNSILKQVTESNLQFFLLCKTSLTVCPSKTDQHQTQRSGSLVCLTHQPQTSNVLFLRGQLHPAPPLC